MNKLIVGGIVLLVLIVGVIALISRNQRSPVEQIPIIPTVNPSAQPEAVASPSRLVPTKVGDRYVPYTAFTFAQASDKKRVLYFHAPWCPICVPIDKEFSSRSHEIPDGVTVFKVDYDTEKELGKKYVVTYQHTFVHVDGNGSEITKWNGGGIAELKSKLE